MATKLQGLGILGGAVAVLMLSGLLLFKSDPAKPGNEGQTRNSTRQAPQNNSTRSSTSNTKQSTSSVKNSDAAPDDLVLPKDPPLLKIENPEGVDLVVRVKTLTGELLIGGRSPLGIPGKAGDLVRIESVGHVSEVLSLKGGLQRVQMSAGRQYTGQVVAAESGVPLANTSIEVHAAIVKTNADGRFELTVPHGSPPELRVTAPNRPCISWSGPAPARIEVPLGVGVKGQVRRADGAPPGQVDLLLVGEQQLGRSFRIQSQSDGRFELPSGLNSNEQIALFAWSSSGWTSSRTPRWQTTRNPTVLLHPPGTILVEGPGHLEPAHTWPGEPALTAAEQIGDIRHFSGLAPGVYRLILNEQVAETQLAPGANATLQLEAKPPTETIPLQVNVIDENGVAVTNAEVRVLGLSGREEVAQTDAGGVAEVRIPIDDAQGLLTISGWAPGRTSLPQVVDGRAALELVMASSVELEIELQPPAELDVAVFYGDVELARARSDATGRVHFPDLPAGEASVVIETNQGIELKQFVQLPLSGTLIVDVSRQD